MTSITYTLLGSQIRYVSWTNNGLPATLVVPNTITSIHSNAINGGTATAKTKITSVTFPTNASFTDIRSYTFDGCTALTEVIFPGNNISLIYDHSFRGCTSLRNITIPASIKGIALNAFKDCTALTDLIFSATNITNLTTYPLDACFTGCFSTTNYRSLLNMYTIGFSTAQLNTMGILSSITSVASTIYNFLTLSPDKISIIGCDRAINITGIKLDFHSTVTTINESVFTNLSTLSSVTFPTNVTSIGANAFSGCTALTSITLERTLAQGLTTLSSNCFLNTGISITNYQSVKNMFNLGYSPSNLNTAGINSDITNKAILEVFLIYNNSTTKTTITGHNSSINVFGANIQIPGSVTSIADNAFQWCNTLTSITIPDSVTNIGSFAFQGCSALTSITIPGSVTNFGSSVFDGCLLLTDVSIGNGVPEIASGIFAGCIELNNINIPNSVTLIGPYAFNGCKALTNISIPSNVTTISTYSFWNCEALTNITIPNSVTIIGARAFQGCIALAKITLLHTSNTGLTLLSNCFSGVGFSTTNYESVVNMLNIGYISSELNSAGILPGVTDIATTNLSYLVFNTGKTIVTSRNSAVVITGMTIYIPTTVTSIANSVFQGSTTLSSINIPSSVTSIGDTAFQGCSALTSITLQRTSAQGLTTLGTNCFSGLGFTTSNYLSVTNMYNMGYTRNNLRIAGIPTNILDLVFPSLGIEFTIVANVLTSASYSSGSTDLVIPGTVTSIGANAFKDLIALTSVTIPSSVTTIGENAFQGCSALTSITLQRTSAQGLTTLETNCFSDLGFTTSNYLSVTNIYNMGYTRAQVFTSGIPTNILDLVFPSLGIEFTIVANVLTSASYTSGSTILLIPDTVTSIGANAFKDLTALTSVTIPSSVTSIGANAFQGCSALTSITLQRTTADGSLTTLGTDCFSGLGFTTTNYLSVTNMHTLGYTRAQVFTSGIPENILDIVFPRGIQITIVDNVITTSSYTSGSTILLIPDTVTSIGANAFKDLTALTSVTIPSSVTSIGSSAFQGCSSLVSVTLQRTTSQGLTTLGTNCFLNIGIPATSILTLYNQGYTRYNLIKSGFPANIVDRTIADQDGEVNITVYYYNADYFG
jgi:hypothetical protein